MRVMWIWAGLLVNIGTCSFLIVREREREGELGRCIFCRLLFFFDHCDYFDYECAFYHEMIFFFFINKKVKLIFEYQ